MMIKFFRIPLFHYSIIPLFLYFLISFSSCKKKQVEIPADVLKKKEMVAVLTDVQIAEAAINKQTEQGKFGADYTAAYYKFIFQKHKITEAQYKRSMDWYSRNPDMLDKVYEDVIIELSKKQSEVAN